MKNRELGTLAVLLAVFFLLPGCAQQRNIEEIKKTLIEFDPPFQEVLAKKVQLDLQIEALKSEFRSKQGEINAKIMELEEELKGVRRQNYTQIRELASQLDPERQNIRLKLGQLNTLLKSKEGLLRTLKSSLRETKRIMGDKKLELSPQEEIKWQKNIDDLSRQLPALEEEIAKLKREIFLYRQELTLLK